MAIFYLQSVQKLVDDVIYKRGLKYYLEGRVVDKKDLILDNWREYTVVGSSSYTVKVPLLERALHPKNHHLASQAINQVVSCDCEYFLTSGICKHIVAVFADMNQEFSEKAQSKKELGVVVENYFKEVAEKQEGLFLEKLLDYLSSDKDFNYRFIEDLVLFIGSDEYRKKLKEKLYKEIINWNDRIVKKQLEKILTSPVVKIHDLEYRKFWFALIKPKNIDLAICGLLKYYLLMQVFIAKNTETWIIDQLSNLDATQKQVLLDFMSTDIRYEKHIISVALKIDYSSYIQENLEKYDPQSLFVICQKYPDMIEKISLLLFNHIKSYSDFLTPDGYLEMADILKQWKQILGDSELFQDAVNYVKNNHKRKPKLLGLLKNF